MELDFLIIIGILLIPAIAQMFVSSNYNKYRKIETDKKISGFEVARKILDNNGLEKVHVVEVSGTLSDHYDPGRKVVRLSSEVFHGETVSATAIAAHEVGHAIQDKEGYFYMKFRSAIFPVVRIATQFSYIVILIGLFAEMTQLFYVGIALVSLGLLFQLVTLPVEFDASKKAKANLNNLGLINSIEAEGTSKVLSAAAMTYVAGVLSSALELLRLVLLFNRRRD